jgi:3-hydroxypropanoate dehydrogenase
MAESFESEAQQRLFTEARSQNAWLDKPVPDSVLQELYELVKWGPTSMNCSPMRLVFIRTPQERERLLTAVLPGNMEKVRTAPVVAIVAYDRLFYRQLHKLFPHRPDSDRLFNERPALAEETCFRNSSIQGGYFILAARLLGLDAGPLSGFDADALNRLFFDGTSLRANFLCCLGYGDPQGLFPRNPRLDFDEVCQLR